MEALPTISIIFPRKPDDTAEESIQAVLQSTYPHHLLEIIEVIGQHPSKQRNLGVAAAQGDLIYFLDNDSIVPPALFSGVVKDYLKPPDDSDAAVKRIAGVGGPNLTPETDGFLQKTFGYALASPFAHFTMCARYTPMGKLRYAGEKELILCNLSLRREVFLREGGFNESLYPNEENEFMNRLRARGYHLLYDPEAVVFRSRRNRCRAFIRQLFTYGRGRAEQILVEGMSLSALLFFLPLGLLGYLGGLTLLLLGGLLRWWMLLPLALYAGLAVLAALQTAVRQRQPLLVLLLPLWSLLMHLAYGIGLLYGLSRHAWNPFKQAQQASSEAVEVVVRKQLG
ncbi:glycosyltransferase [candidate division KSB3 bacterium]|uniref:Glycosyltransferase n=1 Tax=candidate division KSB3 bacterium TaxID=2044937 RepID=A0A9D5K046_9BACT|nr:glycosyltransferase [candidate division KSB3 bacterium]MBD3327497.1 glycosyltransferase [candidate division KSB3 bacterium]